MVSEIRFWDLRLVYPKSSRYAKEIQTMSNKTSCIQHPARAMLVLIREEYVAICNGDHCAAALLAYFEHWTNSKLDALQQYEVEKNIASKEGVELPAADLWVYASIEQISFDLLGLYAKRKLSEALDYLCEVGFLSRRNNPIYKWDRTTQYQFEVTIVQHAIGEMNTLHSAKRGNVKVQKGEMNDAKKGQAIPKIHTEIQTEIHNMPNGKNDAHTAMKNAIVLAFGYDTAKITKTTWSVISKAASELIKASATPQDIPLLYRYCENRFDTFTPMALSKHWSSHELRRRPLPPPPAPAAPLEDDTQLMGLPDDFYERIFKQ